MPPNLDALAERLLQEYKFDRIPVPVDRLAKALGAQLRYTPLDDELSGMVFIKDGVPIIGVNSLHHPNRQRFTIAHEIAHLRLHRDAISKAVHVDKAFPVGALWRDGVSATGSDQLEIDANGFAAALLMPRKALSEALASQPVDAADEAAIEFVAKQFRVSTTTLHYRLRGLGAEF